MIWLHYDYNTTPIFNDNIIEPKPALFSWHVQFGTTTNFRNPIITIHGRPGSILLYHLIIWPSRVTAQCWLKLALSQVDKASLKGSTAWHAESQISSKTGLLQYLAYLLGIFWHSSAPSATPNWAQTLELPFGHCPVSKFFTLSQCQTGPTCHSHRGSNKWMKWYNICTKKWSFHTQIPLGLTVSSRYWFKVLTIVVNTKLYPGPSGVTW